MNEKFKNNLSLFLALLIVGSTVFAIMYWLVKEEFISSVSSAIAATLGGWLAPLVLSYFKKNLKQHS
jgi:uncharacterized membrane protein YjjB (DUF3815 family)